MTSSIKKLSISICSIMAAILFGVLLTFNIVEAAGPQLNRDLSFGIVGTDVLSLQQFLNGNGYTVAAGGAGAPGHETTYYGFLTKDAVIRFQAANGLAQTGICDSATRVKIANWNQNQGSSIQAMIEALKVRIADLQKQLAAILAGEEANNGSGPDIISLKVADGGDEGVIDAKDTITITFNKAIDPESINSDLNEDDSVTGVSSSETGGVAVSSTGKVTIKNIASFDMGSVDDSGTFTSKLALNSTGKILTITLTSGNDIEIDNEDFDSVTQLGGTVEDKNGNAMEEDNGAIDATGTFGGEDGGSVSGNPYITSIVVDNGGSDDYIDTGDTIKITFSEAIDPESINGDLDNGESVSGITYAKTGGVTVSSVGRVTIKNIAAFTAGEVTESGNFTVKLALNSTGKILTVTLTSGDDVEIQDENFMAAVQIGGVIEDTDHNVMKADSEMDDPTGTFGGNPISSGPAIKSITVTDDDTDGYVAVGDTIKITFNEAVDPTSINDDLDAGDIVTGVSSSETGGVAVSSTGKVTIKNIASFDMGSVDDSGTFDVSLELDDTGKILTVNLESGNDIEIASEDFNAAAQIGGTVTNEDGDEMDDDSSIGDPTGSFGGNSDRGTLAIDSIDLDNGGDEDYMDEGDTITIAFSDPIDPSSISSDLDAGDYITGVSGSEIGGVTLSSTGKVTVKGVATFTFADVDDSESYTSKLTLNDDADELIIEITSGDAVQINDADFDANTTQIGGTITNEDGDEMESDSNIDDPNGNF